MKREPVHVGEETEEIPSELQKLLARGSTPPPEQSLLDGLLARPISDRSEPPRVRRVLCSACKSIHCKFSYLESL